MDGLEGLSPAEVADTGDELPRDVLVIPHAYFDGCEDPEFLLGDEVQVLSRMVGTEGSNFIVVVIK